MEADGAPHLWVLLIVSEPQSLWRLKRQLGEASRERLIVAGSLHAALRLLDERAIDVVVAALSLPDARGLEVVRRVRAWAPQLPLIVLSEGALDLSVEALRAGAQDYLSLSGGHRSFSESIQYALERKQRDDMLRPAPALPSLVEASEIVELRGGVWGHQVRAGGGGGDPSALIASGLQSLQAGHILVEVDVAWFASPGPLQRLSLAPSAARLVLGVGEVSRVAGASDVQEALSRFRAAGGQVFATEVGERPLNELIAMPLDGLVLASSVCALAQERRGAPLVRALVSLAEESGWVVVGAGEALRFLGCRLIRRDEWSGLQ